MEMTAKAPRKGDVRDVIKKLVIKTDEPHEQIALARFYKAFKRGDHATLQVVAESDDALELLL
jgi:hypothetical protein